MLLSHNLEESFGDKYMAKIENVIIGNLLVEPHNLFALNEDDWNSIEKEKTLFTNERFLPKILVEAGIVPSISEVRRNRKDLVRNVEDFSFESIKWGKKFLFIACGGE